MIFFNRVKVGQIWRFQTSEPNIYLDYKVLKIKDGWVLYEEIISRAQDYTTLFNFKVGMERIK